MRIAAVVIFVIALPLCIYSYVVRGDHRPTVPKPVKRKHPAWAARLVILADANA